ncbi:Arc family DNA-binding protein [Herbiconiux sp. VKM Ac-2851]|uniref:FitA-like ribbon-helix-helix domain-containing protein n=1 Tax=Herbiconiux sp. VKM Ac-2851 TaxID=2739025 RepID=UPI001566FBEE|nr:Arc family DNA-binding protein [Herbiconiux sp. VKM Ac-2851]NQX33267.1 Arc family DNA-binding protein [Herbiconiux sp. VKM Ac-2851]
MAAIVVRNLDDDVQRRLKERAAQNHRSMEAEARAILTSAVSGSGFVRAWLELGATQQGNDLVLPPRSAPRSIDLS